MSSDQSIERRFWPNFGIGAALTIGYLAMLRQGRVPSSWLASGSTSPLTIAKTARLAGIFFAANLVVLIGYLGVFRELPKSQTVGTQIRELCRLSKRTAIACPIYVILLAPVVEEIFFRGVVQSAFCHLSNRPTVSILCQGMVFGAAHGRISQGKSNWFIVPTVINVGLLLGYVRENWGLHASMLLHGSVNTFAFVKYGLLPEGSAERLLREINNASSEALF